VKARRAMEEEERLKWLGIRKASREESSGDEDQAEGESRPKESLLLTAVRENKDMPEETEAEKRLHEEQQVLKQITTKQALKSVKELAKVRCAVQ